jgi:hypothetical protein
MLKKSILKILAIACLINPLLAGLPVVMLPGFGSNQNIQERRNFHMLDVLRSKELNKHQNKFYWVDYAPLFRNLFGKFENQVASACNILDKHAELWKLKENGFIILGLSQGGLVSRGIIETCEIGAYVKRLITLGTPHQGIMKLPVYNLTSGIGFLVSRFIEKNLNSINRIGPSAYFKSLSK